jgi:hypothetical protein
MSNYHIKINLMQYMMAKIFELICIRNHQKAQKTSNMSMYYLDKRMELIKFYICCLFTFIHNTF